MPSSWWRLFPTSKGSLTFAVGDEVNRKAEKVQETMGVNAHSKGKISNDPEIYIIKNIYYIYHKYDTQQLY